MGPCFAQLSLTSCVPETAAAAATQQQHHPAATIDTAAAATNYSREITTITISTETAKPNIVPVFVAVVVVVIVVLAFFASNYKHIRLTQMHNKMSLDLRQKTEIKPEKEQEKERERGKMGKRNEYKTQ